MRCFQLALESKNPTAHQDKFLLLAHTRMISLHSNNEGLPTRLVESMKMFSNANNFHAKSANSDFGWTDKPGSTSSACSVYTSGITYV